MSASKHVRLFPQLSFKPDTPTCSGGRARTDFVAPNTRFHTKYVHADPHRTKRSVLTPACSFRLERILDEWTVLTNPEGDQYFLHAHLHIVTYANVRVPSIRAMLTSAHSRLVELGRAQDPQIAEREVYIQILTETPAPSQLEYYFIDSSAQQPFWVHGVRMQDLGLSGFETPDHLSESILYDPESGGSQLIAL